jgi:hypothetical protein
VVTYRKNVKDEWEESMFSLTKADTEMGETRMKLAHTKSVVDGVGIREIRKLSDDGHQTSIITTN